MSQPDRDQRVVIPYLGIGNGRAAIAHSVQEHAQLVGYNARAEDLGLLPEAAQKNIAVAQLAYKLLSHAPSPIYTFARNFLDRQRPPNNRGPKHEFVADFPAIRKRYLNEWLVLSASPVVSRILTLAGVHHWGVLGDNYIHADFMSHQVVGLGIPRGDIAMAPNHEHYPELNNLGGIPQPTGFLETNWVKKRERLGGTGRPLLGYFTHGAGEMGAVDVLRELAPLLGERADLAVFAAQHHGLAKEVRELREVLAKIFPNLGGNVHVWEAMDGQHAVELRAKLLPTVDMLISPVPNEQATANLPLIVTKQPRNANERINLDVGRKGGWIIQTPLTQLLKTLQTLFEQPPHGSTKAQLMLDSASRNMNSAAGRSLTYHLEEMHESVQREKKKSMVR